MGALVELASKHVNVNDSFISNICSYFGEILPYMEHITLNRDYTLFFSSIHSWMWEMTNIENL